MGLPAPPARRTHVGAHRDPVGGRGGRRHHRCGACPGDQSPPGLLPPASRVRGRRAGTRGGAAASASTRARPATSACAAARRWPSARPGTTPPPSPGYEQLVDRVAVYPAPMDACEGRRRGASPRRTAGSTAAGSRPRSPGRSRAARDPPGGEPEGRLTGGRPIGSPDVPSTGNELQIRGVISREPGGRLDDGRTLRTPAADLLRRRARVPRAELRVRQLVGIRG